MTKNFIAFLLVISSAFAADKTPVLPCGTQVTYKRVAIYTNEGLCTKMPCTFKLGETLTVEMEFSSTETVSEIKAKCMAKLLGNEIDFPIPNGDKGCDALQNTKCPVSPNKDMILKTQIQVKPPYMAKMESVMNQQDKEARIDVKLKVFLLNQNNKEMSCFQLSGKVIGALSEEDHQE